MPSWVQGGSGPVSRQILDNSCQRKEGSQRQSRMSLWRRSGVRFPLVPVLCFWFGFGVCVFGGGGCGAVCCVGVGFWFGLGVMVFDVGVVWMGGSMLGPVWDVCVWLFALLCVSLLCCFGGEF